MMNVGIVALGWGRRAAAAALLCLGGFLGACGSDATGLGLELVSQDQLAAIGRETWQQIRAETPVSPNTQHQQIADRVARRVLEAAGRRPHEWEVMVFAGDEANAFALPGQRIGVYEGMFDVARNDAQLAAVLAHEVAHLEAGHPAERLSTSVATQLGAELAGALLGGGDANAVPALLGAGARYGINLPFSRNQELEADRLGLRYMAEAGYDPREALELWRAMERRAAGSTPTLLSTHPAPSDRIEAMQAQLPQALALYRDHR